MVENEETYRIAEILKAYQTRFEPAFSRYFASLRSTFDYPAASEFVPESLRLIEDLSIRGGKRQRVAFLYEAAKLVSDEEPDGLLECAFSIELLQTHLLIHDDLIDDSPLRRAAPTTYYAFRDMFPDGPKTALGMTILAGDIAMYLAIDVLKAASLAHSEPINLASIQVAAGLNTFAGQIYDLERDEATEVTEEMLLTLADFKAARSSSVAPMEMGLLVGGGLDSVARERVARYSYLFGVASQFQDDYLGMFGDSAVMGKSAVSDMREGRRTFLILRTLEVCTSRERMTMMSLLGNADAADDDFEALRQIVRDHGIDDEILGRERHYAERASQEAHSWRTSWNSDAVDFFEALPTWSIERRL